MWTATLFPVLVDFVPGPEARLDFIPGPEARLDFIPDSEAWADFIPGSGRLYSRS